VQVHEVSYLDNAELNLKQLLPMPSGLLTTNILFGLRHINVREVFDYNSQPAPTPPTVGSVNVNAHTINDIYGAQIGALFEVNAASNAWISFEIKGALCDNAASRDLNASVGGTDTNHPRLSEAQTVYVGDFNLAAYWRPTQHVTARIGYQAIWIDGLALAEENFHPNLASLISTTIQPPLNCSGTVLYHGPYAGLELHW
jgi:hypothetical protein